MTSETSFFELWRDTGARWGGTAAEKHFFQISGDTGARWRGNFSTPAGASRGHSTCPHMNVGGGPEWVSQSHRNEGTGTKEPEQRSWNKGAGTKEPDGRNRNEGTGTKEPKRRNHGTWVGLPVKKSVKRKIRYHVRRLPAAGDGSRQPPRSGPARPDPKCSRPKIGFFIVKLIFEIVKMIRRKFPKFSYM